MPGKHINTFLQLAFVLVLFSSVFLVKTEFFNGIVTGKQYGLELGVTGIAVYLIFMLPFKKAHRISLVDAGVLVFCTWFLLNELITGFTYISFEHAVFITCLWLAIYIFIRQSSSKPYAWGVISIWLAIVLVQSLMGLMQLHGKTTSFHSLFNITGTFHNPGPFAGFVISALPLALGVILGLQQYDYSGKKYRYLKLWKLPIKVYDNAFYQQKTIMCLCYGVIIALLLVIPAARSRAAWIAGLAGCAYVLWRHPGLAGYRYKITGFFKKMSLFPRIAVITLSLSLLLSAGAGLYLMKQGSASGRLLMWQVTWEIVKEKPLLGHGAGSFNALYMPAQARWFESGKGTQAQVMVAGSPQAPFNELVGLWLEKGLIGILLTVGILAFIFYRGFARPGTEGKSPVTALDALKNCQLKKSRQPHLVSGNPSGDKESARFTKTFLSGNTTIRVALEGTLTSILVFGLFSYPFDISSFILQLVIVTALLGGYSKTVLLIGSGKLPALWPGMITAFILLGLTARFIPQRVNHYKALETWRNAERLYSFTSYNTAVIEYEKALPALSKNGLFLQMFGKALSMDGQNQRSLEILELASGYYNSHILWNAIGDGYKVLGNYKAAEAAYIESSLMMPVMLFPRYLLAKLYHESGQHEKARQTAKEVLNSPVKVESSAIREMINEMSGLIESNKHRTVSSRSKVFP
jgi:O-antigen polymerase